MPHSTKRFGAQCTVAGGCEFAVWAPLLEQLSVHVVSPAEKIVPMSKDEEGRWRAGLLDVGHDLRYFYRLKDGRDLPDPASDFQPEGVFGPSAVVNHPDFAWQDRNWQGIAVEQMVIYELHVGTFTTEGTFDAVIAKLDHLVGLGINAVEIMPVAQFSGERNWGYDGVFPFAVQNSYGGPLGLKKLVDACHHKGLAVILDVVYNHLGPEGNFLGEFMPYFTDKYRTPWGKAINYDGEYSDGVREYFISNALHWFEHYHVDALRLDAVHGIFDLGAEHILKEMSAAVDKLGKDKGRPLYLIAESDLNDVRVVLPRFAGGHGCDAQWADDFHHCLHTLLTGENTGYYADFGGMQELGKAFCKGFVYTWDFSRFRLRRHGSRIEHPVPPRKLVVCSQNHDQIGNRLNGDRLSTLVPLEGLKLAAAAVILSPFVPMIFMGEEYGEKAPFLYFMSFKDEGLIKAVREGRRKEFAAFNWKQEPRDPYSQETFERSKLTWGLSQVTAQMLLDFYKHLIALRKNTPVFASVAPQPVEADTKDAKLLALTRRHGPAEITMVLNFDRSAKDFAWEKPGQWKLVLDSSDWKWMGPGPGLPANLHKSTVLKINPLSAVVYGKIV